MQLACREGVKVGFDFKAAGRPVEARSPSWAERVGNGV